VADKAVGSGRRAASSTSATAQHAWQAAWPQARSYQQSVQQGLSGYADRSAPPAIADSSRFSARISLGPPGQQLLPVRHARDRVGLADRDYLPDRDASACAADSFPRTCPNS